MKVGHFAVFAPHGCGLYHTVRDLIFAERMVGIDAQFIDFAADENMNSREGLQDGELTTVPMAWAEDADIVVSHSAAPDYITKKKPAVMALHGRPESSFKLELLDKSPIITTVRNRMHKYKGFITFWRDYTYTWGLITGKEFCYIPAPVNFEEYNPEGETHEFRVNGNPNIIITDMWREDTTPFNVIVAAQYFKEHYAPDAKLHIYGLETKSAITSFLSPLNKKGLLGELYAITSHLCEVYRAADMLITPNIIATRVVRESLASGCPIVAPVGCEYTPFTAEPRDYRSFAEAMNRCWKERPAKEEIRGYAKEHFSLEKIGVEMKQYLEKTLCN